MSQYLIGILLALKLITMPMALADMSAKDGVDPRLAACVVQNESAWNVQEVSTSGAVGLFQVMPETAQWTAGKLGMASYDLMQPVDNIRIGLWVLKEYPEWYSTLYLCEAR